MSLCELPEGEVARIARVDFRNPREFRKFMAMGVLPGSEITLIRRRPVCVFRIGESEFAIDDELAQAIIVERTGL